VNLDRDGETSLKNSHMNIERNEPCYCGSGKKYKKCCLPKDEAEAASHLAEAKRQAEAKAAEASETRRRNLESDSEYGDGPKPSISKLPLLPPDDQKIVDAWWAEVSPVYMKRGGLDRPEWLLERTVAFLDEHPRLFPHLDLQMEFLLEVGPALDRVGLMDSHHALLRRLRDEQPEAYEDNFGYWDLDLLVDALQTGNRQDIPACLKLFRENPIQFVDEFAKVVNLLAWQGCESELRDLLEPTANAIYESDEVVDGGFGMHWLTILAMLPILELGDTSAASLEKLYDRVMAVGFIDDNLENREWLLDGALMALPTELEAALNLNQPPSEKFIPAVGWSFTGWLRRNKGLPWTSARFLAESMLTYWDSRAYGNNGTRTKGSKASGKSSTDCTFGLDEKRLSDYFLGECQEFFGISAITVVPALQALHFFTEYLVARGGIDSTRAAQLQAFAQREFDVIKKEVGENSAPYRIYPTYAALVGAMEPC
jgi:hypothetical protein